MVDPELEPSAPSLAALPDDLLVACFEQLDDPLERCTAPIVSRWPPRGSRGSDPPCRRSPVPHLTASCPLPMQAPPAAAGVLPLAAPGR